MKQNSINKIDFTKHFPDGIIPLKKFGQNYIRDKNIINKIVKIINPLEDDIIIEIGPGLGSLTEKLSSDFKQATKQNYFAIEIDKRVIDYLREKFPDVNFINQDILLFDFQKFYLQFNKKIRIVGNIPYNLTSPIIFKLIENRNIINDVVIMVQLDVAKRLIAKPRTKDYGILTVILNTFADVELCFKVSPNVFVPKPRVDSAIIHFTFRDKYLNIKNEKIFLQVVKSLFNTRRKTIKNSLNNSIFASINFSNLNLNYSKRAEELSIEEFISLSNYIFNQSNSDLSV